MVLLKLLFSQVISFLLIFSSLFVVLESNNHLEIPCTNMLGVYLMLVLGNLLYHFIYLHELDVRKYSRYEWIMFALIGLVDSQASFLMVLGISFTTLTSYSVLIFVATPSAVILSKFILGRIYRPLHYISVLIAVAGVIISSIYDSVDETEMPTMKKKKILGDILIIISEILISLSNVLQEKFLQEGIPQSEYLLMLGIFATPFVFSEIFVRGEQNQFYHLFNNSNTIYSFGGFLFITYLFYQLAPILIQKSGASFFNIGLLSSPLYANIFQYFILNSKLNPIEYYLGFIFTIIGICMFSLNQPEINSMNTRMRSIAGNNDLIAKDTIHILEIQTGPKIQNP